MNYMNPVLYGPAINVEPPFRRASSATFRKRSTSGDPSRHSFASRKSESDKDFVAPSMAPIGVVFMEQIALDIDVEREPHTDVKYVLRVRHLKSNATWSHARGFDEYRRFQHRLLKALNHGHFCNAECPWLYTFLKSYFPKKHLFEFTTARVIASRKDALERFFISLQNFLLNRANHNCSIIATAVVDTVVEFVYGEYAKYYELEDMHNDNQRASFVLKGTQRGSECPVCPEDDEISTASGSSSSCPSAAICMICESSLEGDAYASSRIGASTITNSGFTSTASSTSLVSDDLPFDTSDIMDIMPMSAPATCSALSASSISRHYVMTLGCGHQFHDECIVPKLNETLRCPTCDHLEVK